MSTTLIKEGQEEFDSEKLALFVAEKLAEDRTIEMAGKSLRWFGDDTVKKVAADNDF